MIIQYKNIFLKLLGIPVLISSLFCFAAVNVVLSESFTINKHGDKPGFLATGHSEIIIHTRDSDGTVTKIEKQKTSNTTLLDINIKPIKVNVTYTISLDENAILSAHLKISPEKTISGSVPPDIQQILETGYLEIWNHIMASKKIEILLEVNKPLNQMRVTFKVNDQKGSKTFPQEGDQTDNICRAILATQLINSIMASNPVEEFTGINFILGLHNPLTFKRLYGRGKTAAICHRHPNCPTGKIDYKVVRNVGFTTGYRFCQIHKNYSLGYFPVLMHLLQRPIEQRETGATIDKPESIFVHLSSNTPMIAEALQSRPFLFLEEVRSLPTVPLFLKKTGFELLAPKYDSSIIHAPKGNQEHMHSAQLKHTKKFFPSNTSQPLSSLEDLYHAMPLVPTACVSVETVITSEEGMSSASLSVSTPDATFNVLQDQVNGMSRPNK